MTSRLELATHDYCPRCAVPEAFHPECCPITPEEWRKDAKAALACVPKLCKCCTNRTPRKTLLKRHGEVARVISILRTGTSLTARMRAPLAAYMYRYIAAR